MIHRPPATRPRTAAAVAAARAVRGMTRLAGRGGTSLPGMVAERVDPRLLATLRRDLGPVVLVAGTNGKTTTSRLVRRILDRAGPPSAVGNASGANMRQAIAASLALAADARGRVLRAPAAVFEVDELALAAVARDLSPTVLVLVNLFRDQLDRYGEVDAVVRSWSEVIERLPEATTLVICGDDPRLETLVADQRRTVVRFGIGESSIDAEPIPASADPVACRACGAPLTYAWRSIGHLGAFACPHGHVGRRRPDVSVTVAQPLPDLARLTITTEGGRGAAAIAVPGLAGAYDAGAAIAAAMSVGVDARDAIARLDGAQPAFGRHEVGRLAGRRLVLMLVKNAASLVETGRVARSFHPAGLLLGLNDHPADGRDVSWIWDADLRQLARVPAIACTGTRALDLVLRLKYDDIGADRGRVAVDARPASAVRSIVRRTPIGSTVVVLATYTALLEIRASLEALGAVGPMPS